MSAQRMKLMRKRRRPRDLRALRLAVPDSRSHTVRRRVAAQIAGLDPRSEREALGWIERVSAFDRPDAPEPTGS